jgi:hypothetical protein
VKSVVNKKSSVSRSVFKDWFSHTLPKIEESEWSLIVALISVLDSLTLHEEEDDSIGKWIH